MNERIEYVPEAIVSHNWKACLVVEIPNNQRTNDYYEGKIMRLTNEHVW